MNEQLWSHFLTDITCSIGSMWFAPDIIFFWQRKKVQGHPPPFSCVAPFCPASNPVRVGCALSTCFAYYLLLNHKLHLRAFEMQEQYNLQSGFVWIYVKCYVFFFIGLTPLSSVMNMVSSLLLSFLFPLFLHHHDHHLSFLASFNTEWQFVSTSSAIAWMAASVSRPGGFASDPQCTYIMHAHLSLHCISERVQCVDQHALAMWAE